MPVGDPVTDYDGLRQHDIALKTWIDDNLVHKSGTEAETIGGVKTYSSSPLVPTPADNDDSYKAANTAWVKGQFADLHLPLWIGEGEVGTEFYVNGSTGSDSTGDGSQPKPWKTIAFATEFIANNYNVNSQTVHINVAAGTYTDPFNLSFFSRTSGAIVIRPATTDDTVNIAITNAAGTSIRHTGGKWELQDLNLKVIVAAQTVATNSTRTFLRSEDQSGELLLTHCDYEFEDQTVVPQSGVYGTVTMNMISAPGGYIRLRNKASTLSCSMSGTRVNAIVYWLYSTQGGIIRGENSDDAGNPYVFNVAGAYSTFFYGSGGAYVNNGTPIPVWNLVDVPTGKRYNIVNGGRAETRTASPPAAREYFPGSIAGTVDTSSSLLPALGDTFSSTPIYSATLVEDITFSDETPYTINLPGAPYSQVDAWFTTAVGVNTAVIIQANYENGAVASLRCGSFVNTSERVDEIKIFQTGGLVTMMFCSAASTAGALSPTNTPKTVTFTDGTGVTAISLLNAAAGTATLPAGTVITVYGAK